MHTHNPLSDLLLVTRHKYFRLLFAALLFMPVISMAWEGIDKDLGSLGTHVREVWSGGYWKEEDVEGFYRFVVIGGGYEHYKTKLYVQWIKHGSDMERPGIVETTGISELNDNPIYAFGLPECIGGWECNKVEIDATHTYVNTSHKFNVHFTGVGHYDFK